MTPQVDGRAALVERVRRVLSPVPWRIVRRDRVRSHARYLLEEIIFPALRSRADIRNILFVGCDTYTRTYPWAFTGRNFVTMDIDPIKARYGADRHLVDTVANVRAHFGPSTLDAVICNGVIGWGLDQPGEIDQAVRQCFFCLRPGGIFIVGWNDLPPWRPPPFEKIDAFRLFAPLTLVPFSGPTYHVLGANRHVFSFYVRPSPEGK